MSQIIIDGETKAERKRRLGRERQKLLRAKQSIEQITVRRQRDAERHSLRRLGETEDETIERRKKDLVRHAIRTQNLSQDEKELLRLKNLEYRAKRRERETSEQAMLRKQKNTLCQMIRRQKEMPEQTMSRRKKSLDCYYKRKERRCHLENLAMIGNYDPETGIETITLENFCSDDEGEERLQNSYYVKSEPDRGIEEKEISDLGFHFLDSLMRQSPHFDDVHSQDDTTIETTSNTKVKEEASAIEGIIVKADLKE